jgi:hypothetical protein
MEKRPTDLKVLLRSAALAATKPHHKAQRTQKKL